MKILKTIEQYLSQSGYQPALVLNRHFSRRRAGLVTALLGALALVGLFLTFLFLQQRTIVWGFLGFFEISLGLFLLLGVYWLFLGYEEREHLWNVNQIKRAWDQEAFGRILSFGAAQFLATISHGEDLLLAKFWEYILSDPNFMWIWRRLRIPTADLAAQVEVAYAPAAALGLGDVLRGAWQKALGANHLTVEAQDILIAVFSQDKIFQKAMFDLEIEERDLREVADWQRRRVQDRKSRAQFWTEKNLLDSKGIGKDWSAGYTLQLDRQALDFTELVKYQKPPAHLYGHRREIEILEQMLVRAGGAGNVALVGPPGVGRHALLRALAAKLNSGETLGPLRYMRLLQIDSSAVITGTATLSDVLGRVESLFTEALLAGDVILVINNFDAFLDPHPEAGRVNATEALLPFLQSRLRVIGIMTPPGYQATIGKNNQLERLIGKLEITEPSPQQTLLILEDEVPRLERRTGLWFTHQALQEIVKLTAKLIQTLPNPEKSLDVLEETAVLVATKIGGPVVLPEHVQKLITMRTKVPVEKIAGAEKDTLLNLENILHHRIVGQDEAITELANALRRARSGIRSEKRPIGSFLFLGPTGVGKTETTKALAAVYFGSEQRIIRLDMSEFQEIHSINRLIGDAESNTGGLLTEAIITNPFSLILLDELEKAHPKVLDLFLQVLDDGRLTDALGRTVSFVNAMIIATSNAGAESIRQMVKAGKNPAEAREQLLDEIQHQGIFRPEFLNRFDAVIIYRPLNEAELQQVATLILIELNERLAEKDVQIKITPELALAVARGGYTAEFGARPLRRFVQEHIENYVAKGLISGEIKRGDTVPIPPELLEKK